MHLRAVCPPVAWVVWAVWAVCPPVWAITDPIFLFSFSFSYFFCTIRFSLINFNGIRMEYEQKKGEKALLKCSNYI